MARQCRVQEIVCSWFDKLFERLIQFFCFFFYLFYILFCFLCGLAPSVDRLTKTYLFTNLSSLSSGDVLLEMPRTVKQDRWINVGFSKHPLKNTFEPSSHAVRHLCASCQTSYFYCCLKVKAKKVLLKVYMNYYKTASAYRLKIYWNLLLTLMSNYGVQDFSCYLKNTLTFWDAPCLVFLGWDERINTNTAVEFALCSI